MNCSAKRSLSHTGEQLAGNVLKKKANKSALLKQSCLNPEQPEYFEQDGLLCVRPYFFHHSSFAKRRWIGMSVVELYTTEFLEHPSQYYQHAIEREMIKINGNPITPATKIKESDFLHHTYHKHEPPVLAKEIKIIFEDENVVVVDKPGSFHAHPTGRYFHNTVISRLKYLHGYEFLSSINRLDRLTSGIMILAKNADTARKLSSQMSERQVEKEYLAKVDGKLGKFDGDVVEVDLAVGTVNNKLCIHSVFPEGLQESQAKESKTIFTRRYFCPLTNTTIVNCKPLTGRTHQIRVHLRHLGHPISNDRLYNNKLWDEEKISCCDAQSSYESAKRVADKMLEAVSTGTFADELLQAEMNPVINLRNAHLKDFDWKESLCYQCAVSKVKLPAKESLFIYLHAYRYSLRESGQVFETELPEWARGIQDDGKESQ